MKKTGEKYRESPMGGQKCPYNNRSYRQHRGGIKEDAAVKKATMHSNERKKLLQENLL
jgi:hypothetical protein